MSMDEFDRNKVRSLPEHDENNKKKKNARSLKTIIYDYADRTTIHGLPYLIVGASFKRKLIWLVFMLCSVLYLLYNGITLFRNFFNHPTMTKNKIIRQQKILFPAITICNYNAVRKNKAEMEIKTALKDNGYQNWNVSNRKKIINKGEYDIETLYTLFGHTMDEDGMFVDCKWKGKRCSGKDFKSSVQSMGLCHTFNSGNKPVRI